MVSPNNAKKKDKLDQPLIQNYNDTVMAIKTDPLIDFILPEVLDQNLFTDTIIGLKKVSTVIKILHELYKEEETPMIHKLVLEIREVLAKKLFMGEIYKNTIVMPYTSFLI